MDFIRITVLERGFEYKEILNQFSVDQLLKYAQYH